MDAELRTLLATLYEEGRHHDAGTADRRERRRNVEPESARLLAVLIRALKPREILEDALETLASAAEGSWELIFLDAERPAYPSYWPELLRTLRPGGLLVVDNVISHEHELTEFRALVERDERAMDSLVPIGAGMPLVVKHESTPAAAR
jgi:predicted O-methyltransferase YrrM